MKKLLAVPLIIGLVAVPSFVSAQHGADDSTNATTNVRSEDRLRTTTRTMTPATDTSSTQSTVTVPGQTDPVRVETEGDVSGAVMTMEQAIAQAQAVFPGKIVTKVEVENEHNALVYSIRFSDGSRMDIDANTGAVVRTRDFTDHDNRDNEHRQSGSNNHEDSDSDDSSDSDSDSNTGRSGSSGRHHSEDD